jgi:hypothetical protein
MTPPDSNIAPITVPEVPSRLQHSPAPNDTARPLTTSATPIAAPVAKVRLNARMPAATVVAPNDSRMLIARMPLSREAPAALQSSDFAALQAPCQPPR